MSDQKRLRVAVIGAGGITPLRHVPAFRTVPGVEVVGVIDTHADRAASVAARCRLAYHGTSLDQPWFEAVDAVSVAVPPLQHFPVVSACLERGKHVLLEKPFTVDAADAERLTADADGRRLVLAMVHNLLFSRGINRLRALRDAGALGDMLGFHVHQTSTAERLFPPWRDQLPFGLFFDESPHPLYLLRDIGGEVTFDGAMATPSHIGRNTPAAVTVHLTVGGRPATLYSGFEASLSEWHVIVYGSRALAAFDIFRDILVVIPHDGRHTAGNILRTTREGVRTHLSGVVSSGVRHLTGRLLYGNAENFRRFVAAIRDGQPPAAISAADGLVISRLQHQIVERLTFLRGQPDGGRSPTS